MRYIKSWLLRFLVCASPIVALFISLRHALSSATATRTFGGFVSAPNSRSKSPSLTEKRPTPEMFRRHRAEPCRYCPNVSMFIVVEERQSPDIPLIIARLAASTQVTSILLMQPKLEADIRNLISRRRIDNVRVLAKSFEDWGRLVASRTGIMNVSIKSYDDIRALHPIFGVLFEDVLAESYQTYWGWAESSYILGDISYLLRGIRPRVLVFSTLGELWTSANFTVVRNSGRMTGLVKRVLESPSVQNASHLWVHAVRSALHFAWMQKMYKSEEILNEPCHSPHSSWLFVAGAIATERVEGCWFIDHRLFTGHSASGASKFKSFFADSLAYDGKYILGSERGKIQILERIPEDVLRVSHLNGKLPVTSGEIPSIFIKHALSYEDWCLYMYEKHGSDLPFTMGRDVSSVDEANLKGRSCELYGVKRRNQLLPYPKCGTPVSKKRNKEKRSHSKVSIDSAPRPLVAVMSATTSRHVYAPRIGNLALFNILLLSLVKYLDCGIDYLITIAYDVGDAFYDTAEALPEIHAWFDQNFRSPLLHSSNINATLLMVRVNNTIHRPGPAMNAMARAAYDAGAEFFYRVNDDTEINARFAIAFIEQIRSMVYDGLTLGVVGPSCAQGNTRILTHDFVHRTHMEIFNMSYYPEELIDWFLDNWISAVYGCNNTRKASAITVTHHTGAHGQRYLATSVKWTSILVKTQETLVKYIEKHASVRVADGFRTNESECPHEIAVF